MPGTDFTDGSSVSTTSYPLDTSEDIRDAILADVDEPTDGTSKYEAVTLRLINIAVMELITSGGSSLDPEIREDWEWAKKHPPGSLVLTPFIEASTVAVTLQSTAITFASAPAASMAGWHFRVTDDDDVFRISTHVAGAAGAVLGAAYTGDTDAVASYKLMKLEYDLAASLLRLFSPMRRFSGTGEIEGRDLRKLEADFPLKNVAKGVPTVFAIIQQTSAGLFKVRFNKYVDADTLVEYDYIEVPDALTGGSSLPLVPVEYRSVIKNWAHYDLLVDQYEDAVSPETVKRVYAKAVNGLHAMAMDNRRRLAMMGGENFSRILPREDDFETRAVRTEGGLEVWF